jgi:tetratricopeptide (TPR) repeat protein
MIRSVLPLLTAFFLLSCTSATLPIDQIPMYGGMDRQAVTFFRLADQQLIDGAVSAFGTRQNASKAWANKAFHDYADGNSRNGIRRFNQAWLLDKSNPESYWGFGLWYQHLGDYEAGHKMFQKAYKMGLREEEFLKTYRASENRESQNG